jgi:hypothetical protein
MNIKYDQTQTTILNKTRFLDILKDLEKQKK